MANKILMILAIRLVRLVGIGTVALGYVFLEAYFGIGL